MPKVFINYRRADAGSEADLIHIMMSQHFGEANVFLDVESIPYGRNFRDYLADQIAAHDVVLVLIGRDWAQIMQERAAQDNDFVRIEIESALQQDKLVIPVLVEGAPMPKFTDLPDSIAELQWLNLAEVRRKPYLAEDCTRLANGIQEYFDDQQALTSDDSDLQRPRWIYGAGIVALVLIVAIVGGLLSGLGSGDKPEETRTPTSVANVPSDEPSATSTDMPTDELTASLTDTFVPTDVLTLTPSFTATDFPSTTATDMTTDEPTASLADTLVPTDVPTLTPSFTATDLPTATYTYTSTPRTLSAQEIVDQQETQAATLWTPTFTETYTPSHTPTVIMSSFNWTETIAAEYTARFWQTATAVTQTPTLTPLYTETNMPTATLLPPGFAPVMSNNDWEPLIQEFNGVEMALVPAGCFMMGSTDEQLEYAMSLDSNNPWVTDYSGEQPAHQVCFTDPFWIDIYEVTNIQFGYRAPYEACLDDSSSSNQPRICVTLPEAIDHCEGRGSRLPTEAEWEYAARGPDSLIFPWGNEWIDTNVVYYENSNAESAEPGTKLDGISWVGAFDMSGNIGEFTGTVHSWNEGIFYYPYVKDDGREDLDGNNSWVVRGGTFGTKARELRTTNRDFRSPSFRAWDYEGDQYGFRCARDYQSIDLSTNEITTDSSIPDEYVLGFTPVLSNGDWQAHGKEFDGVEMVLVPTGCFMMGSDDGDDSVQPIHKICFDEPFWIDVYEVTNAQYGSLSLFSNCSVYSPEPNQPRNCVSWFEARDFCEDRGARLPSEAEWEYAARGPDNLIFPWGNEFIATNTVFGARQTFPVGTRLGGVSWVGALDMSGNVWEWTSTIYDPDSYPYPYVTDDGREDIQDTNSYRVLRGGGFQNGNGFGADGVAYRYPQNPDTGGWKTIGFRCARSFD